MIYLYFDPGLGAMLAQGVVALTASFLLFSKGFILKIKSFFGIKSNKKSIDIEDED